MFLHGSRKIHNLTFSKWISFNLSRPTSSQNPNFPQYFQGGRQFQYIKMKFFTTALENFAFLGIEWDESSQKYTFNRKNIIPQIVCVHCITLTLLFLIYDAKSFVEYTETLFILSTAFLCGIVYISVYIKVNVLHNFFESCNSVANMSK